MRACADGVLRSTPGQGATLAPHQDTSPTSDQDTKHASGQDSEPTSDHHSEPTSGHHSKPTSGHHSEPTSGQDSKPNSGQDSEPTSGQDSMVGAAAECGVVRRTAHSILEWCRPRPRPEADPLSAEDRATSVQDSKPTSAPGGDACVKNIVKCPKGHALQPYKAQGGRCDVDGRVYCNAYIVMAYVVLAAVCTAMSM